MVTPQLMITENSDVEAFRTDYFHIHHHNSSQTLRNRICDLAASLRRRILLTYCRKFNYTHKHGES